MISQLIPYQNLHFGKGVSKVLYVVQLDLNFIAWMRQRENLLNATATDICRLNNLYYDR